nr:DUF1156 domain-containing protein [uncultured Meiothermus sp.]
MTQPKRKLIEVALPLEAINREAAREKSIRHGHPSTLHLWWARRPLAAARAVLFASLVDDPSARPEEFPTPEAQEAERRRLFDLIERLVKWENSSNAEILAEAKAEILKSTGNNPPPVLDPFAGGGTIPLEAQRLGLEAHASDLNPVAVLINKALIEIPPKFAGHPPVNPESRKQWRENSHALSRVEGLAKGAGGSQGGLPIGSTVTTRGNLRDAVADYTSRGIDPGEHRGGMDAGIESGEGAVSGDCPGLAGRDGDIPNPLRGNRLVSQSGDRAASVSADRSRQDADHLAAQLPQEPLISNSSSLFPRSWKGAKGLAEDVRHYGRWMRDEAEKRIGHLYPKARLPGGGEATVIAWLWARTVQCPNPACGCQMPLVRSWVLSSKPGKEHYVEPVINHNTQPPSVSFAVKQGKFLGDGTVGRKGAKCIACSTPVPLDHVRSEGRAGRMRQQLMAIVAEGVRGRVYLEPTQDQLKAAQKANPSWKPDAVLPHNPRDFKTPNYGLKTFADLFTPRQLEALTTFSDLVGEARGQVLKDAKAAGLEGEEARGYTDAMVVYLGLTASKTTVFHNTLARWRAGEDKSAPAFGRQALPMVWDYAEVNPFAGAGGDFYGVVDGTGRVLLGIQPNSNGSVSQHDAASPYRDKSKIVISTDPPYYDNIGYADLSDFFYVWLRRVFSPLSPELFGTLLVPKAQDLVATPHRFGGSKEKARLFFEAGLEQAFSQMRASANEEFPVTVYYAFKQSESDESEDDENGSGSEGTASTGWETMLSGLINAGFQITGTWPMRTEGAGRMIARGTNALASSIVLVCRPRPSSAPVATRRELLQALRSELPGALRELQQGNIAPVDLAQAAIGPGMAVYSRYSRVLESDGTPMRVRTALALINQMLDEVLAEQEGDFDADTRWALAWFEQSGFAEGEFGVAETLSKAKNTSIQGLVDAGILRAKAGKVRLLRPDELPADWNPTADTDLPVWEATHHLIRAMNSGGEQASAKLLAALPNGDTARELAYRLYAVCERKKWAQEGLAYNALVTSWLEVSKLAQNAGLGLEATQETLL